MFCSLVQNTSHTPPTETMTDTTTTVSVSLTTDQAELVRDLLHREAFTARKAGRPDRFDFVGQAHLAVVQALHADCYAQ